MGFEQSKWVWMNGELIPWNDATIHVSAHGLHYGSGVFEGMRCYETPAGPAIFRLDEHLARLAASAEVYGIEIPYSLEMLAAASCEVVRRNEFTSCYVRPVCFFGSDSLGLHPRNCPVEVVIFAWPWAAYLGNAALEQGVRLTVSPWRKFRSDMMPPTAKACGQYLNSILAIRDAASRGFNEALLLDSDGYVAEASGENLFIVRDDKIFTNDDRQSILLGITRDSVIKIARDLGYVVDVSAMRLSDLYTAHEVFLTGTAAEVTPVCEIDSVQIGNGRRGIITADIQKVFFDVVAGRQDKYNRWLTVVNQAAEVMV
jgi:branched-chain amino acid aminotransferase